MTAGGSPGSPSDRGDSPPAVHLPEIPPTCGRRTPVMLASEARERASQGSGQRLVGRLYSQVDGKAGGQCGMPNILSSGAAARRKDDDITAQRRTSDSGGGGAGSWGGDPQTQTTSLGALRQPGGRGKAAAQALSQPRKIRVQDLRDTLCSSKAVEQLSPTRKRPAPRPETSLTCLSAKQDKQAGVSYAPAMHRDPQAKEQPPAEDDPEDSVMHFVRRAQRGDPMGKFVYLVMRPRAVTEAYNPYDLRVVTHKDTDPTNYFTMAKEGVTHVQAGEADFIALDEWVRECQIFTAMRKISFFAKYRRFKTFYFWKKYVRRTTIAAYKDSLEENLFFLNRDLSYPLLRTRAICQDLVGLPMFAPFQETKSLEQYMDLQNRNRESVARKLDHKIRDMRDIIDSACKAAMASSAPRPVLPQKDQDLPGVSPARSRARSPGTVKSHAAAAAAAGGDGQPERQSYIELSQRRAVCRRLTSFIRLCDYMCIDALVQLTMKSVAEVKQSFLYPKPTEEATQSEDAGEGEGEGGKTAHDLELEAAGVKPPGAGGGGGKKTVGPFTGPVFFVEVALIDDGILIQPNLDSFIFKQESVVKGFTDTIVRVERFVQMAHFQEYTKHVTSDHPGDSELGMGPDVNEMVTGEESFKRLLNTIRYSLQAAFADVEEYAARFDKFRMMFLENRKLDIHHIKEEDPSLDWFREERQKYKTQQTEIDAISEQRDVAIFTVKTLRLKEKLAPSPVRCLEQIDALLPLIAKEKNDALMSTLGDANARLENEATTVEEFVEFIKFHTAISDRIEELQAKCDDIKEIHLLIDTELDSRWPEEFQQENKKFTQTKDDMKKLQQMIGQVDETKDRLTHHFSENVDGQLSQCRTKSLEIQERANDPIVESLDEEPETVLKLVSALMEEMEGVKARTKELTQFQELMDPGRGGDAAAAFEEELGDVYRTVGDKLRLWQGKRDWAVKTAQWSQTVFADLDHSSLEQEVQKYDKLIKQVGRTLTTNPVVTELRGMVDEFRLTMPVIACLKNPTLKEHHWKQIDAIVGREISQDPEYTLGVLMELKVMDLKEEITQVSMQATQEQQLEELLQAVQKKWQGIEFIVNGFKDQKDTYVIGSVEDILGHLEDSSIVVSTIASNRFCQGGLQKRTTQWEEDLKYMSETLDKWLELQRKWMYLESIFSNKELQTQWPDDAKKFQVVDKRFRDLMKKAYQSPGVRTTLTQDNYKLRALFTLDIENLERIEKALEYKLDQKRRIFARFYFLSNDDLLDILANIRHPEKVAPHMLKMFDNIKKCQLTDQQDVTHMVSAEGEKVAMAKVFKARGPVEKWLGEVEVTMVATVRKLAKVAWEDYAVREKMDWIFAHPCQLVLVCAQIFWTKAGEDAVEAGQCKEFEVKCNEDLQELAIATARDLNKVARCMIRTLITLEVHNRDLAAEMRRDELSRKDAFGWTKLLRFYWTQLKGDDHGDAIVRQNTSEFVFGYEYLGALGRLVITPLTDRVFMTITGALEMCLGTAPSGPAGTGKTESVKDLAKGLGRQCIVYNCSDGVTYKMMETFIAGLCQTGAWTCLDEFNRISIEVLSVVASQLTEVRAALQQQKQDPSYRAFTFQGTPDIGLKNSIGCKITMNPGYAGRTELPDNLKALFRPISVMTPDFRMIAEVILFSEGFANATNLSLKITQLYKLSSEQLSAQNHYDFGMRALKSILVMAGDLKRSQPDVHEDLTLIIACNDSNIPKFVVDDIPLFKGIMSDLFPGVEIPEREYEELDAAIEREFEPKKYQMVPTFITKIYQLYETCIVRHGVMTVGATGGGKTVCRDTLAVSLTDMYNRGSTNKVAQLTHQCVLNPKSITMGELYGVIDVNTNEWQDGILPIRVKQCRALNDSGEEGWEDHQWIVFDGPVDTLWVESMNSVLDDSKLLCLDNGVRIRLPDTIHMMFEVADLAVASPATVSRCGMVFMDFDVLGWFPTIYCWARTEMSNYLGPMALEYLQNLCQTKLEKGLKWLRTCGKQLIGATDQNIVHSCCELFYALCETFSVKFPAESPADEEKEDVTFRERKELINVIFAFCFIWSVGGNVDDKSREQFDTWCRECLEDTVSFSGPHSVYDFQVDFQNRNFVAWEASMPTFEYDPSVPFFDILVPTVDTVRFSFLLKTLLTIKRPVMFSGQSGTGKSVIIQQTMKTSQDDLGLVNVVVQFSAKTSAHRTQDMIESKLKVKRKNLLGAPMVEGKKRTVALFIDDLNMPALETFGASPPVELLRQMMGNGGFYDRRQLFWKTVEDVTVLAACGPPEGGRSPVTPRLLRMFHLLEIPNLSEDSMIRIFRSILDGHFKSAAFSAEVRDYSKPMVDGSVEVYNTIRDKLRPRPSKPHYTFNLRDLSKVFQGIMQVVPRSCSSALLCAKLWAHENQRCFYDRLVSAEDKRFFTEEVMMPVVTRLFPSASKLSHEDMFEDRPIIWGDFLRPAVPIEERMYEECQDLAKLPRIFTEYLDDYNINTSKTMNLVFFNDHCYHLARIIRILRQPRGNALLVGIGGSGKQSLTRLSASICQYQCFQIEVNSKYNLDKFHEDLLELYNTAGIEQKSVVFLMNDTQIVDEGMVEDMNNMLNSGEVPSLFTPEEKDKKINQSMERARDAGMATTRDDVYAYFVSRVRDNMHIVLCMSPVGDAFRTRCRNFPSLTNCCAVDWFDPWPDDALLQVARRQFTEMTEFDFKQFEVKTDDPERGLVDIIIELCVEIHSSVTEMSEAFYDELRRRYYVTPTSYLEFISLYLTLLDEKHGEVCGQLNKLKGGSEKMKDTNTFIAVKQKEITAQQPLLEESAKKTAALLDDVSVRKEKAAKVRESVGAQEAEANEQYKVASALKADAEADLAEALPALEAAEKALQSLDKSAVNEIKSYANPPKAVEMTMQAVMILLDEGKYEWKRAKDLLGRSNFLSLLLEYDRDHIPKHVINKVARFINDDEFTPEKIEKGGSAATKVLCIWCHATYKYYNISVQVAPKRAALEKAEADLEITNKKLKEAQTALKAVEDELAELERTYKNSMDEKAQLEENIATSKRQLANAEVLTDSLGSESESWARQIVDLGHAVNMVPGNVFLSSASIVYFGAFTPLFRKRIVSRWLSAAEEKKLPVAEGYSLVRTLADPMQIREWQIYSLPTDETSSENAVLCNTSCDGHKLRRWPLMIDPQGQATKWIKAEQTKNGLQIVKMTDPKYLGHLEQAIRGGRSILIDDIGETLDPALEPVLQKQVIVQGGRTLINLGGDHAVDYDPMFRLYMCTKMANPHYLPEICIKVTLINFTVTGEGLEDQLLGDVVSIERADLEEEKSKVIKKVANGKKSKKHLEDKILRELESSQGNVLDNPQIIDTLKKSKSNSQVLLKQLADAEEKEKGINEAREVFRVVANRASILYFVLVDLPLIDPMYQYSLDYFKRITKEVIAAAPKHDSVQEHLDFLRTLVTETVYEAVCRGLFNRHKIVFSVMMCSAILRGSNAITPEEWTYYNRASALVSSQPPDMPKSLSWMSPQSWGLLDAMERTVPKMQGITKDICARPDVWQKWYELGEPQEQPLPDGEGGGVDWAQKCSSFMKCIIMRCFREEKLYYQLMCLCRDELGKKFIEAPAFNMERAHKDSATDRPIIFILSQGSDPTDGFFKWAKEEKGRVVKSVSLGQGQEGPARRCIESGKKAGDWVLLQNCHLGKSFMTELQDIVATLDQDGQTKDDFRLWLTSMPADYFPVLILQNSIKLTNEAPSGIKANMKRSYDNMKEIDVACFDDEGVNTPFPNGMTRSHCYKKLLYGMCFFHAIILERRKFGPLGWCTRYEWNDTDLFVSKDWLKHFLAEDDVPWESMNYIIGQINYGGRVTDPLDRLCMMSHLQTFFRPDILDDAYCFSSSGVYRAPVEGGLEFYRQKIDALPAFDDPEVFGMHENSNLRFQLEQSQGMMQTLLGIQPRATGGKSGGGVSPEEQAKQKAVDIFADLPDVMELEEAGPTSLTFMANGTPNSLSTVLRHEVDKFNKLLRQIAHTLVELQKALSGLTILSEALDAMYMDFLNDNVPALWTKVSYLSMKPLGSWMKDFVKRVAFARHWLRKGEPATFWMSGMFSPHGFMTGILQGHARQFVISVDILGFGFEVLSKEPEEIEQKPSSGVYVHGIYSDSWRWDKEQMLMADSLPKQSFAMLPVIHFLPEAHHKTPSDAYRNPCFITSSRKGTLSSLGASTNFVLCVETTTDKGSDYWIQKGAAMVCQLPN